MQNSTHFHLIKQNPQFKQVCFNRINNTKYTYCSIVTFVESTIFHICILWLKNWIFVKEMKNQILLKLFRQEYVNMYLQKNYIVKYGLISESKSENTKKRILLFDSLKIQSRATNFKLFQILDFKTKMLQTKAFGFLNGFGTPDKSYS